MTTNIQSRLEELIKNRKSFIETVVPIENKERQLVPFKLNPIQARMVTEETNRDVTVKPAQVGGTSLLVCDFLLDCLMHVGTTAVLISYDEFITGRLLRKAQSFYDNLHSIAPSIPEIFKKSTYEKTFLHIDSKGKKLGESSFYIASAKGFSMPRGEPIHDLGLDEFGFWPAGSASDVFAASMQRVPLLPNTKIKVLSTPNGSGNNDFYQLYMSAKEGKEVGKSIFTSHFYCWMEMPEYSMKPDSMFTLPGDAVDILQNLSDDEMGFMELVTRMGFDEEECNNKLRWRRFKQAEMMSLYRSGKTQFLFNQEYPENDVSCFLSAGDNYFDINEINALAKECFPAPDSYLDAQVWEQPLPGVKYMIAIDPGLGKKSLSVALVLRCVPNEICHVATLAGAYPDYDMASRCIDLGRHYNMATLAPEDALGITSHLKDYPELYYRTDPVTGLVSKNIGWMTSPKTKPFMLSELRKHLSHFWTHDVRLAEQLPNIRWDNGRTVSDGADDFVMAAALGVVCRDSSYVANVGFQGTHGWTEKWGNRIRR